MLCLVRAAGQQLCQACGVRGQWLKCAAPCAEAVSAHIYGIRWRGDKRLVDFHSNEKHDQPFVIRDNVIPFPFLRLRLSPLLVNWRKRTVLCWK